LDIPQILDDAEYYCTDNISKQGADIVFIVGEFERVSFGVFRLVFEASGLNKGDMDIKGVYDNLLLPERATSGSAGYDFKTPVDLSLAAGETITIPTGIRAKIDEGWWLAIFPRSGHGFKYRIQLDNTVGVIDSDFYSSPGEGHIMIKLTNDSREGKTMQASRGTGFAQGVFLPYGITRADGAKGERKGGFGSTGG